LAGPSANGLAAIEPSPEIGAAFDDEPNATGVASSSIAAAHAAARGPRLILLFT
jgi:hypothetical protein